MLGLELPAPVHRDLALQQPHHDQLGRQLDGEHAAGQEEINGQKKSDKKEKENIQ